MWNIVLFLFFGQYPEVGQFDFLGRTGCAVNKKEKPRRLRGARRGFGDVGRGDYHRQLYTFRVKSRTKDAGIYRPRHRWEFSPSIRLTPGGV